MNRRKALKTIACAPLAAAPIAADAKPAPAPVQIKRMENFPTPFDMIAQDTDYCMTEFAKFIEMAVNHTLQQCKTAQIPLEEVAVRWYNVPDEVHNPDMNRGWFHIVFRRGTKFPENMPHLAINCGWSEPTQ